jgi:hypothetical protein
MPSFILSDGSRDGHNPTASDYLLNRHRRRQSFKVSGEFRSRAISRENKKHAQKHPS